MAARRRATDGAGETASSSPGSVGTGSPGTGVGYQPPLERTVVLKGDTWRLAAKGCFTVTLRRLEELAAVSGDIGELLRVVERVSDVVATAEAMEGDE